MPFAGRVPRSLGLAVVAVAGTAVALVTMIWAERAGSASWSGGTSAARAFQLLVGLALIAAGLRLLASPGGRGGSLLCAAGFAWYVADWNNQYTRTSVAFTLALTLSSVTPVLVGHAVLRYSGALEGRFMWVALATAYLSTVGLAVAAADLSDPRRSGCGSCPHNLLVVGLHPSTADGISRLAVTLGPLWCGLLIAAIAVQHLRSGTVARRRTLPVQGAGIAYLVSVLVLYIHAIGGSYLTVDQEARALWAVGGVLLLLLAAGTLTPIAQRRHARRRVARLVVDLASAPSVGNLSTSLAQTLGDPSVRVLYPSPEGVLVDADGRPSRVDAGQRVAQVVSGDRTVAVLAHGPHGVEDAELAEIGTSARIVLENERLRALTKAHARAVRESRRRLVRAGDQERRRLERDLHDGAQQSLVTLSVAVQLASMRGHEPARTAELSRARKEVVAALSELRSLGRGIYPSELADDGLAAALQSLAEAATSPLTLSAVPSGRFPADVEAAAYQVVAQLARRGPVDVQATTDEDALHVRVTTPSAPTDPLVLVGLQDRVGAVGGSLVLDEPEPGPLTVRAVLPCVS